MRKLLEVLRLHCDKQLGSRDIAKLTGVGKTTINRYIAMFEKSTLTWPLASEYLNEENLSKALNIEYVAVAKGNKKLDFVELNQELKSHKNMTLQLLWEEMRLQNEMPYSYGHFSKLYKQWKQTQPSSMRQEHKAGQKVFVDYSGDTIPIYTDTGTVEFQAQIFVAALGASDYLYFEATASQKIADWTMSHVRMFEHFGGVPELVISDNLKSAIKKPSRYDPCITPAYYDMLRHYQTTAMPARIYTPKDKADAENGVLIVQRWVIAVLRKQKYTSLYDLNQELKRLMGIANNKKFQRYPCTRMELFTKIDKPALMPLPSTAYVHRDYKKARVGGDYHVELNGHYYSVPFSLVRSEIDIWYTTNLVECIYNGKCVAKHVYSTRQRGKTTTIEHMPPNHRKYAEMTPENLKTLANSIGIATGLIVDNILQTSDHEEVGCRKGYGFLCLAKKHGNVIFENVCNYAINIGVFDPKNIEILLSHNIPDIATMVHSNIRGANYYSKM